MYAPGANLGNTRRRELGYEGEHHERKRNLGWVEETVSVTMTSPSIGTWHTGDQDGHTTPKGIFSHHSSYLRGPGGEIWFQTLSQVSTQQRHQISDRNLRSPPPPGALQSQRTHSTSPRSPFNTRPAGEREEAAQSPNTPGPRGDSTATRRAAPRRPGPGAPPEGEAPARTLVLAAGRPSSYFRFLW